MISILIANIINFKIIVTHMVRTVRTSLNISPILFHQIRPTHRAAPVVGKDPRLAGAAPGDGHLDATSPAVLKTAELPTGNSGGLTSELILTFAAPRSSGVNTWVVKQFVHKVGKWRNMVTGIAVGRSGHGSAASTAPLNNANRI